MLTGVLYINEFMADNDSTIKDPDDPNNFEDRIEIYNAGAITINLSGKYLTDDLTNPTKWRIPDGITIPAGGFLLFWADGDEDQGDTHTSFNLNRDGEEIGLFDTDAKWNMAIDTIKFGVQSADVSYGRSSDGCELWKFYENSTPGYSNYFISIEMELNAGWSMISLPVRLHDSRLSKSKLFPNAVVVYGFEKGRGYVRVAEKEDLEVGKGYWILLKETQSQILTGQHINEYTHPVYGNGWEMIGGCSSKAKASANNCKIEVIYGFVSKIGYKRILESESLDTGRGYWILINDTIGQADLIVQGIESLEPSDDGIYLGIYSTKDFSEFEDLVEKNQAFNTFYLSWAKNEEHFHRVNPVEWDHYYDEGVIIHLAWRPQYEDYEEYDSKQMRPISF